MLLQEGINLSSLVLTVTETLRYKGAFGQLNWALHRLTGLGILFFLIQHVIDTSWAVFFPDLYVQAIAEYQTPLFTIGEFALVAAVVYHALNGWRIVVFDYRPELWKHQERAALGVLLATGAILIPVFIIMFGHVNTFYFGDESPDLVPLVDLILNQLRFIIGIGVAVAVALLFSFIHEFFTGRTTPERSRTRPLGSKVERFWWSYMRISGMLIIPLVFGHLAIMHLIQGVFDITAAGHVAAGATGVVGVNETGTAVEFVYDRWNTLVGGVAIWRIYDAALLALVVLHGFNGLRYIFNDYARQEAIRRGLMYATIIMAVILIVVGAAALIVNVDQDAVQLAAEAMANLHAE
ncbi:MAG: hypothetical protein D6737_03665 [Chloroflexi bacterium]|nr:MAG: hypothetical protein CUN54_06295 [Phototrophicales bacterium]RMF81846.1 MAG: hypothetical protein D6737_03665 [Chloroflexota bacterium]